MWVRGLKLLLERLVIVFIPSHPMWVRGLKPQKEVDNKRFYRRTPCGCVD